VRSEPREDPAACPAIPMDVVENETIFQMDDEEYLQTTEPSAIVEVSDADMCSSSIPNSRSFHHREFYSDTEVDASGSPQNSRPGTPIQSDSEYEISKVNNKVRIANWKSK